MNIMRRFDKKEKIRKANILLEKRMRNLKEYGSEFGPEGEFEDSELQGQEDFYDNMNRNSKEETSDVNEERPITARYGDDPTPEEKEFIANFVKTSGDKEETSDVNEDFIEDGVNPITGYDLDKVSPGSPKQNPRSTHQYPSTYSSSQIEKSKSDIRNRRDLGEAPNEL